MFAGVALNDQLFTVTGDTSTKFKATTDKLGNDWLEPNYDDSKWTVRPALATSDCAYPYNWATLFPLLKKQFPYQSISASWLPNRHTIYNEAYFRLVIPKGLFTPNTFPLLPTPTLISQKNYGYVNVSPNFFLTFDLRPNEIITEWGSIVHFTNNANDLSRLPGIWFSPNSNDLHIRFSGIRYTDKGFKNIKIPTGVLL
jgi:hypothetical protein